MIVHEDVVNFERRVNGMPQVFGGEFLAQVHHMHSQLHAVPAYMDTVAATLFYITLAYHCFSYRL